MTTNYMSRLYEDCHEDSIIHEIKKLTSEDIRIIQTWNDNPLSTHYELSQLLKIGVYDMQKRILIINRAIKSYVKKNYNLTARIRVCFFRQCLVCNTIFVAQSSKRLCSPECVQERHLVYKKKYTEKISANIVKNNKANLSKKFVANKPVHDEWIPVREILRSEYIKMSIKSYVKKYGLTRTFREDTFTRRDGRKTKKNIVCIKLQSLYDLAEIKHELYRVSNNIGLKHSFDYWFELYNELNTEEK